MGTGLVVIGSCLFGMIVAIIVIGAGLLMVWGAIDLALWNRQRIKDLEAAKADLEKQKREKQP